MEELTPILKGIFLTRNLSEDELKKLAGAMQIERFKRGELIIKYGDIGSKYYVLSKGNVKVTVY